MKRVAIAREFPAGGIMTKPVLETYNYAASNPLYIDNNTIAVED